METTLKFDKVVLVKELNEKFNRTGEIFEVANILEHGILLRNAKNRVAIGVVSFDDFERCFVTENNFKGWTKWQPIVGFDGQNDAYFRTNRRKTQVKFITDKVRAEACRSKVNEFNLSFGVQMAYLRCLNKSLEKKKLEYEKLIEEINHKISENESAIRSMMNSLEA